MALWREAAWCSKSATPSFWMPPGIDSDSGGLKLVARRWFTLALVRDPEIDPSVQVGFDACNRDPNESSRSGLADQDSNALHHPRKCAHSREAK